MYSGVLNFFRYYYMYMYMYVCTLDLSHSHGEKSVHGCEITSGRQARERGYSNIPKQLGGAYASKEAYIQ